MDKLIVHTDGGSRSNPGPSGIGVVINDKEYCQYIGEGTNNEAEYKAVIFALQKAKSTLSARKLNLSTPIEIYLDSELVCEQLSGGFKIKEESLWPFFMAVWNIRRDLKNVSFHYIPREENRQADKLVNRALDEQLSKPKTLF